MNFVRIPKQNLAAFCRCLSNEATSLFGDEKYDITVFEHEEKVVVQFVREGKTVRLFVPATHMMGNHNTNISSFGIAIARQICSSFGVLYEN